MIKKLLVALLTIAAFAGHAQQPSPEMADSMRQDGKIYVVITVIGIIFFAIVMFLVYVERKISRLEEQVNKKEHTIK